MMTPQWDLLNGWATDELRELTRARLFDGLRFFDGHTLRPEFRRGQVKFVLLLVRLVNPKEHLSEDETALVEASNAKWGIEDAFSGHQTAKSRISKKARKPRV